MRVLIFLLIFFTEVKSALPQAPSKQEMQNQMGNAVKVLDEKIAELEKQIDEAIKNGESEFVIGQMKNNLKLMKDTRKSLSGSTKQYVNSTPPPMAENIEQQQNDDAVIPKKDETRISSLPKKTLTEAELIPFIKNVNAGVAGLIPAIEKTEALNIYNETKAKYKTTAIVANAATGCWMLGHWEKALFIIGKACSDDPTDADNLNNYASFLIMTGGEQAAIPILEYLNSKYPNNSTILNNLGQAWFGLGDMEKAKKYLSAAKELCPNHSMANSTLYRISLSGPNPDTPGAISSLKASLKGGYDPSKKSDLAKLGYNITYDDLPPFNYPMQSDPFNLIQLIKLIPRQLQTNLDDPEPAYKGQSFINGVEDFYKDLEEEDVTLEKQAQDRASKLMSNISFQQEFIEGSNCPAHLLAAESVIQLNAERVYSASSLITQLWMPYIKNTGNTQRPIAPEVLIQQCMKLWNKEVKEPIIELTWALAKDLKSVKGNCNAIDAIYVAFLEQRAKIYNHGVDLIQNEFVSKSRRLQTYIYLNLYAIKDVPPKKINDYTYALVDRLPDMLEKQQYGDKLYKALCSFMEIGKEYYDLYSSACKDKSYLNHLSGADNIKGHKIDRLPCEYQKIIRTPVDYTFELDCGAKVEETNTKLKKRYSNVDKGSVESSKPRFQNSPGPIQVPRGPSNIFDGIETQLTFPLVPLTAEDKDLSQFSLEYNKAGNLVALNFQLNEDGTTLKDPDSVESGVDSRWCWNARASSGKGYMNKLLMNQK